MLDILKNLISAKSVSPNDAGLMNYISEILSSKGFTCFVKEFGEGDKKTSNLYAVHGSKGKNLCFAGHVDVVPSGDEALWTYPPYFMSEIGDKIYGRGAVDMKGAVSCMMQALIDYSDSNNGTVSLLLTSDEEASGEFGMKKMLEWMIQENIKIDFAIVGEPTSDKQMGDIIKIGRRGSVNFSLKVNGRQGHVAYPDLAINPNRLIVKVLNDLQEYEIDSGNEFFQSSNLEIVSIDVGNNTSNVIPQSANARFNIRFNNIKTSEKIISEVNSIVAKHTDDFELKSNVSAEAFSVPITDFTKEFLSLVAEICKVDTKFSTSGGTSDARFIKDMCPLLEFGLLNKTAHQIDEYTENTHLQNLYSVYYGAIKSYHKDSI